MKGLYEEAARESDTMKRLTQLRRGRNLTASRTDVWILAVSGRFKEARKLFEQVPGGANPLVAYIDAQIYGHLGEKDRAFALLEQAYQGRSQGIAVLKVDPRIDALRDDPRFQDLLRRMNFPKSDTPQLQ
jgi:hypothetical protein